MHTINILPSVERELADIPTKFRSQIGRKIDRLALDPFPPGCSKLEPKENGIWRIYSGEFRILYFVQKDVLTIVKVGNRKDVYKNL